LPLGGPLGQGVDGLGGEGVLDGGPGAMTVIGLC
jgi:hypothetical protein